MMINMKIIDELFADCINPTPLLAIHYTPMISHDNPILHPIKKTW